MLIIIIIMVYLYLNIKNWGKLFKVGKLNVFIFNYIYIMFLGVC